MLGKFGKRRHKLPTGDAIRPERKEVISGMAEPAKLAPSPMAHKAVMATAWSDAPEWTNTRNASTTPPKYETFAARLPGALAEAEARIYGQPATTPTTPDASAIAQTPPPASDTQPAKGAPSWDSTARG